MAENLSPQVVRISNETLRVLARRLVEFDGKLAADLGMYLSAQIDSLIDAAGADLLISDGSATDGRTRVNGQDVKDMGQLMRDMAVFMSVPARQALIAKWFAKDGV